MLFLDGSPSGLELRGPGHPGVPLTHIIRDMSEPDEVAEITKQAAEIAKGVPANLQEAAFNRAFDALSQGDAQSTSAKGKPARGNRSSRKPPSRKAVLPRDDDSQDAADVLIGGLNRTAHPEITGASLGLDRALGLLRVAEQEYDIDGMSAVQIAKVLTDKFRLRTTHQGIRQALNAAGDFVDFVPQSSGAAIYRLMDAGEKYLDGGGARATNSDVGATKRKARRAAKTPRKPKKTKKTSSSAKTQDASGRKRSIGKGPKPMVEALIKEGFFDSPKVIGDIQEQLRAKKGAVFKAGDLSPTLVRLLREKALDRDRNDSNQFEYSVPT